MKPQLFIIDVEHDDDRHEHLSHTPMQLAECLDLVQHERAKLGHRSHMLVRWRQEYTRLYIFDDDREYIIIQVGE
jgi:ribulose bisphosphate carboxylase small subunit